MTGRVRDSRVPGDGKHRQSAEAVRRASVLRSRRIVSWLWAFSGSFPLLLLGPIVPFTIAAVWRRSRGTVVPAVLYVAAEVAMGMVHGFAPHNGALVAAIMVPLYIGGFVHALLIRRNVFELPTRAPHRPRTAVAQARPPQQRALTRAQNARRLRAEARELLVKDPGLAEELRIGRPDLPRTFDDGGLVDVNHVPARVLAACVPGLTPARAERVVEVREQIGGFESIEDLEVHTDLPAGLLDRQGERIVFVRDN